MDGFIDLYKEPGFTSHDCVAKLRGILKQKKIGHMGTLDPEACGVLPVALGKATKLIELFENEKKKYETVMLLGITTDTLDTAGTIISEKNVDCSEEDVKRAVMSFVGEIEQIPPMYSARKIGGKKLYELAREGRDVLREPRKITVYDICIKEIRIPEVRFETVCSRGTYIRTLCDDIGRMLGCGACMKHLTRTEASGLEIKDALTLGMVESMVSGGDLSFVIPMKTVLERFESVHTETGQDKAAHNGNRLFLSDLKDGRPAEGKTVTVYDSEGILIGLYRYKASDGCFVPYKMLYESGQ